MKSVRNSTTHQTKQKTNIIKKLVANSHQLKKNKTLQIIPFCMYIFLLLFHKKIIHPIIKFYLYVTGD